MKSCDNDFLRHRQQSDLGAFLRQEAITAVKTHRSDVQAVLKAHLDDAYAASSYHKALVGNFHSIYADFTADWIALHAKDGSIAAEMTEAFVQKAKKLSFLMSSDFQQDICQAEISHLNLVRRTTLAGLRNTFTLCA